MACDGYGFGRKERELRIRIDVEVGSRFAVIGIGMSPAAIKAVAEHFPKAQVTFDEFHVIAHAFAAIDDIRRVEQTVDPSIKGLSWTLLKHLRSVPETC